MIDVQNGKYSSASELSKAVTSAQRAALHNSTAYAVSGLTEINHRTIHARKTSPNIIFAV